MAETCIVQHVTALPVLDLFLKHGTEKPYLNILLGGSVVKVMLGLQSLPPPPMLNTNTCALIHCFHMVLRFPSLSSQFVYLPRGSIKVLNLYFSILFQIGDILIQSLGLKDAENQPDFK